MHSNKPSPSRARTGIPLPAKAGSPLPSTPRVVHWHRVASGPSQAGRFLWDATCPVVSSARPFAFRWAWGAAAPSGRVRHARTADSGAMNWLAPRLLVLVVVTAVIAVPVSAQDTPDSSSVDQAQTQGLDPAQGEAPAATDDTGTASLPATEPPAPVDPAAVIAQWGSAPTIGPEADQAVAQRWFREQNTERARWGVPTAARDPYLDWQAENLLRSQLGQSPAPQPQGVSKPAAAQQSSQSDQAALSQPEFWTISDDLWQAWLDSIQGQPPEGWAEARPGEPWFTRENYLQLFKLKQMPRFDRYRLIGVAGRVNTFGGPANELLSGHRDQLEQIAPGAVAAYEPLVYSGNLVAVVGYDPWINSDGTIRP
jgi:hypothetical protein